MNRWLNKANIVVPEYRKVQSSCQYQESEIPSDNREDEEVKDNEVMSEEEEENIDDSAFLRRHKFYEQKEIQRYNIGVQEKKMATIESGKLNNSLSQILPKASDRVSCGLAPIREELFLQVEDENGTFATPRDALSSVSSSLKRRRDDEVSCENKTQWSPLDDDLLMTPNKRFKVENSTRPAAYNLRRNPQGKSIDSNFIYDRVITVSLSKPTPKLHL